MSAYFTGVPIRRNGGGSAGQNVDASWWNALRAAGILLENAVNAILGTNGAGEVQQNLLYGQSGTAIAGMILSNTTRKYEIKYWAQLSNGTKILEGGTLIALWNGVSWGITPVAKAGDDVISSFYIDSLTGQISYDTAAMSGGVFSATDSKIGYSLVSQG